MAESPSVSPSASPSVSPSLPASGSVTLANMRLSAVGGTAFVDFSLAGTLTPYLDRRLIITDSAGKKIQGYIKAAGTGETYGANLLAAMDLTVGWTASGAVINDADTFTTAGAGGVYKNAGTLTASKLYKGIFNGATTASSARLTNTGPEPKGTYALVTGTGYGVATSTNIYIANNDAGTTDITVATSELKQVLTPAATGVTIVSTYGGTTYNWTSQESGFNYNDTSGYTYEIEAGSPSASPSLSFSASPSVSPSISFSASPSASPSVSPSASPSLSPSGMATKGGAYIIFQRRRRR